MSRTFIIGDVHGCIDELQELTQILAPADDDSVIFIGDLIDRGPDSLGVVREVVRWSDRFNVQLVLGNHEEKFLRYAHHIKIDSGLEKEMKGIDEFPNLLSGLNDDEFSFLQSAYHALHLPEWNMLLVHGGVWRNIDFPLPATYRFLDNHNLDRKRLALLNKTRYLNPEGMFVSLGEEKASDSFWAEVYEGQWGHVFFGHQPFLQAEPKRFTHATGIDTGCVYGGWLSAVEINDYGVSYTSVPARKTYSNKK